MSGEELVLEFFYSYGFRGKQLMAVRAPFAMSGDGAGLIGRRVRIDGASRRIVAISRQISGPIARGEPIGVEAQLLEDAPLEGERAPG